MSDGLPTSRRTIRVEPSWVMQFYSQLEIKAKSPRGSVHITEAVEAIVLQEGEL